LEHICRRLIHAHVIHMLYMLYMLHMLYTCYTCLLRSLLCYSAIQQSTIHTWNRALLQKSWILLVWFSYGGGGWGWSRITVCSTSLNFLNTHQPVRDCIFGQIPAGTIEGSGKFIGWFFLVKYIGQNYGLNILVKIDLLNLLAKFVRKIYY